MALLGHGRGAASSGTSRWPRWSPGLAAGLYFPAYSAVLPSLVPEEHLLAANGLEGVLRPALMQAAGPAIAAAVVGAFSPAVALAAAALAALVAAAFVLGMPLTAVRREVVDDGSHPVRQVLVDVREGFVYMVRTPWLLATLVFASVMILVMMGPFEVLAPFAIKDRAGGGPAEHAWVLAAFGVGGALGSLVGRLAAPPPPLPHGDEPGLGCGLHPARGVRHRHHGVADGRRRASSWARCSRARW